MFANDVAWLGDDAELAPAARAGLGILIAALDWTWWTSPSQTYESLSAIASRSNMLKWGGDSSVLDADRWVDSARAVRIARAFQGIVYESDDALRLRIERSVWKWPGGNRQIQEIRAYLGKAISPERVVLEWPRDVRPRRQVVERNTSKLIITGVTQESPATQALLRTMPDAQWVDRASNADIAIGSLDEILRYSHRAEVVMVLSEDVSEVVDELDNLRSNLAAQCVMRVPDRSDLSGEWMAEFIKAWIWEEKLIDDATHAANQNTRVTGELVATGQTFLRRSGRYHRSRVELKTLLPQEPIKRLPRPLDTKSSFEHLEAEYALPDELPQTVQSPPPSIRVMDCRVTVGRIRVYDIPKSGNMIISVGVIVRTPLHRRRPDFPEARVEWVDGRKSLQIHMIELERDVRTGTITLGQTGNSTLAQFNYKVETSTPVDIRFIISDGARIIQTARFKGKPGERFDFLIESTPTPVEQVKEQFDLALLVNDSLGGRPSATTLNSDGVHITALDSTEIMQAREEFRESLQTIVKNPDIDISSTMFTLASKGKTLLDALKRLVPDWPETMSRVQLMTQADAFFPLEYLYEGVIPERRKAGLCPERAECLASGVARPSCSIRSSATHLCPMGFVGVTTVIERHTWDQTSRHAVWLTLPRDLASRNIVNDLEKVAFGASLTADAFEDNPDPTAKRFVRIAEIGKALKTHQKDWDEWKDVVAQIDPTLLVLVAHIDNHELFIGDEDGIMFGSIGGQHIGTGRPVVIAIGCNSALTTVASASLPAIFMSKGARVVVAALTEVLGRHANEAAKFLAVEFQKAAKAHGLTPVGDLLLRLRRNFLMRDIALGLVLVAFGDADLALGHID